MLVLCQVLLFSQAYHTHHYTNRQEEKGGEKKIKMLQLSEISKYSTYLGKFLGFITNSEKSFKLI